MKRTASILLLAFFAAAAQPPSDSAMSLREAVNYAIAHSPRGTSTEHAWSECRCW